MNTKLRPRVIIVCGLLIIGMLRASYWQWQRHLEKQVVVAALEARLKEEPRPITSVIENLKNPDEATYRRVLVSGTYDYDHEVTIRNRRLGVEAGVHVVTPLRLTDSDQWVLVNRGFAPLGLHEGQPLSEISRPATAQFVGLIKGTQPALLLAPQDTEPSAETPFVKSWLRPDLAAMGKQLPYPILPVYLEIMSTMDPAAAEKSIVSASNGREDIMMLKKVSVTELGKTVHEKRDYPVPVFDTVAPPTRHLGYVYEWASMALVTLLIGTVLHLKGAQRSPPRPLVPNI